MSLFMHSANTSDVHMDFGNAVHDCRIGAVQILAAWLYRCLKQYLIGKKKYTYILYLFNIFHVCAVRSIITFGDTRGRVKDNSAIV